MFFWCGLKILLKAHVDVFIALYIGLYVFFCCGLKISLKVHVYVYIASYISVCMCFFWCRCELGTWGLRHGLCTNQWKLGDQIGDDQIHAVFLLLGSCQVYFSNVFLCWHDSCGALLHCASQKLVSDYICLSILILFDQRQKLHNMTGLFIVIKYNSFK